MGKKKKIFPQGAPPPPPPLFCWGGEEWVEPPTKSSKGGRGWGLAGPQLLEGVCWKEGNEFFQGEGG